MITIPVANATKADIVKRRSDVHFVPVISYYSIAKGKPSIVILDTSADNQVHENVFRNLDGLQRDKSKTGMSKTFDETTEVYANANAIFNISGFNESVRVVEFPDSVSLSSVSGSKGGSVSANEEPGIVQAMKGHLYDGTYMVLPTRNVKEADLEKLSDFLYDNQRLVMLVQVSSIDQLSTLHDHVSGYQNDKTKLPDVHCDVEQNPNRYPEAQAAAMAVVDGAQDNFKHFKNQSDFVPNKFNGTDLDRIDACNGCTVVDRADDSIFSSGKTLAGGFIDRMLNSQHIMDKYVYDAQKFVNQGHPFDDKNIHILQQTLINSGNELQTAGYINSKPTVTLPSYAEAGGDEIEDRTLDGIKIKNIDVTSFIEGLNGEVDLTE